MDDLIKLEKLSDEQLVLRLNETHSEARRLYALKARYEAELWSRSAPADAEIVEPSEQPGGLTMKQIAQVRNWAKSKHTTDELVALVAELVKDNGQ